MKKNLLITGITLFSFFCLNAQTFSKNIANTSVDTDSKEKRDLQNLVHINSILNPVKKEVSILNGSSVFIEQIGFNNDTSITTIAENANIKTFQNGNFNSLTLAYTVNSVVADVKQLGNNNRVFDYANSPSQDISFKISQEGNNLTTEKYGTNSLTESMNFKQTGFNKTVIIRSFN